MCAMRHSSLPLPSLLSPSPSPFPSQLLHTGPPVSAVRAPSHPLLELVGDKGKLIQTRIHAVHTGYHGDTHQLHLLNSIHWLVGAAPNEAAYKLTVLAEVVCKGPALCEELFMFPTFLGPCCTVCCVPLCRPLCAFQHCTTFS